MSYNRPPRFRLVPDRQRIVRKAVGADFLEDVRVAQVSQESSQPIRIDAGCCPQLVNVPGAISQLVGYICLAGNEQGCLVMVPVREVVHVGVWVRKRSQHLSCGRDGLESIGDIRILAFVNRMLFQRMESQGGIIALSHSLLHAVN